MTIFELAAELGRALKKDEKLVRLENAKKKYENEPDLQKMLVEYEVQQKAIQNEVAKSNDERNAELLKMIQDRIDAIYDQIVATETYKALEKAQNDVNELMELVNSTITYNITGEQPSSCTHDCSTCGGCH